MTTIDEKQFKMTPRLLFVVIGVVISATATIVYFVAETKSAVLYNREIMEEEKKARVEDKGREERAIDMQRLEMEAIKTQLREQNLRLSILETIIKK